MIVILLIVIFILAVGLVFSLYTTYNITKCNNKLKIDLKRKERDIKDIKEMVDYINMVVGRDEVEK